MCEEVASGASVFFFFFSWGSCGAPQLRVEGSRASLSRFRNLMPEPSAQRVPRALVGYELVYERLHLAPNTMAAEGA